MLDPNNTLITFKAIKPSLWMSVSYFNPDAESGGQIVDTILCISANKLKRKLEQSKTPYEFIQSLIDSGNTVLINKDSDPHYDVIYRVLENAFNGNITEQDKEDWGGFCHYITIGTEETKDPDEYLLSIYAVFDRWGLFD